MSSSPRHCHYHPDRWAIAVCSRCRDDICGACHGTDLRGLAVCEACGTDLFQAPIPWEQDEVGLTPEGFARTAWAVLTAPRTFFKQHIQLRQWGLAAIFGVLCMGMGLFFNLLWQKAFASSYVERLESFHDQLGIAPSLAELLLFASIPFSAIFLYFLHTGLLYLGLRAFGIHRVNWTLLARITGYSMAAALLLIFPPIGEFSLGHFLMIVFLFNLEVAAVRQFFGVGFWKSMVAVFVPFMVFLVALG